MIIKSTSTEGINRRLLLNESIILVNKYDSILFDVNDEKTNVSFKLQFNFVDKGNVRTSSLDKDSSDSFMKVTLHNWYADTYIETQNPWNLKRNGHNLWLLWRINGPHNAAQKVFQLTIWIQDE